MPSLLEYLSYNCNFMGILAGPTCSYNDYIAFIEGTCYEPKHLESNGKENGTLRQSDPSPKVQRLLLPWWSHVLYSRPRLCCWRQPLWNIGMYLVNVLEHETLHKAKPVVSFFHEGHDTIIHNSIVQAYSIYTFHQCAFFLGIEPMTFVLLLYCFANNEWMNEWNLL